MLWLLLPLQMFFIRILAQDSEPSSWPGHLEPLGSQSEKLSVDVLHTFPSPQAFFSDYVRPIKPLLVKGGAKLSPGFSKWTDLYFKSLPESKSFHVFAEQGKKENRSNPGNDMSFYEFVDNYQKKDIYMVHGVLPFLQKDVLLPPPLLCKEITDNLLVDTVMWFSSGGTKSVLHNDDVDNINCLFSGTKELLFIDYKKYNKKVTIDHPSGGYSGVDVDKVDFTKYPGLRDVQYYNVTMETGDCLFIPYKWFHQVRSYDRNIAINVWWTHKSNYVPTNCELANSTEQQTLEKFTFSSLTKKDNEESRGPEDLVEYFGGFLKETKNDEMTPENFIGRMKNDKTLLNNGKFKWNEQFTQVSESIFGVLDADKDGIFTPLDLDKIQGNEKVVADLDNLAAKIEDIIEDQNESEFSPEKDNNDGENKVETEREKRVEL